jgi:hypothetical protein
MKISSIGFVFIGIGFLFSGCEGVGTLFHGAKPEEKYTITFNANGAYGTPPESQTVESSTPINLPDKGNLSKYMYLFDGWNENTSGTGQNYSAGYLFTVKKDIVLYAKWIQQFTVSFSSNGGSGLVPPEQTVSTGSSITLPSGSGLYIGGVYQTFGGWNTNPSGGGTNYDAGSSYTVTGSVTLYAKWRPYEAGDTGPGGGRIFYYSAAGFTMLDTSETCHYLEAAPNDMATTYRWSSYVGEIYMGTTSSAIGAGRKNTALILAFDSNAPAAAVCRDYSNGGKNDWFLPSLNEISQLYANKTIVGNMGANYWYWTSTEANDSGHVWSYSFYSGVNSNTGKTGTCHVRAVRAF